MPTNVPSAPMPTTSIRLTSCELDRTRPYTSTASPASTTTVPASARRRSGALRWGPRSLIAETGEIRDARRAGWIADPTVTTIPTTTAATTVRPSTTVCPPGTCSPTSSSNRNSTTASATPSTRPTADANAPTAAASATTDRITCPLRAPSARRSPSSRVRCETRIVNVLKMMNAPTNTPSDAKPSNASLRNPNASWTCWPVCFATTSADVTS